MARWWKRYKPNQSTLPAAALGTVVTAACLLALWLPAGSSQDEMDRFGAGLARATAHASAGHLLHRDRIELAVIANELIAYPEIGGVFFYDASNDILAMSGSTRLADHYTAPATLDNTLTGYVAINLEPAAFAPPARHWRWLLTLLAVAIVPFLSLGVLQLSARGNRSLPIVSVPDPTPAQPQRCYCLTVNLHNQFALNREQQAQALDDAVAMAQEVCAIHPGSAGTLPGRGVLVLFDRNGVAGEDAICASVLLQRLLREFETAGEFRCYLHEVRAPDAPADMSHIDPSALEDLALEDCLTLAALARPGSVLLAEAIHSNLGPEAQAWCRPFSHPLLQNIADGGAHYTVAELPDDRESLIDSQCLLILGFSQRQ